MNTNYKILMECIKIKDEQERFMILNHRIDGILDDKQNQQYVLEALICKFEEDGNEASAYTIMAIAYALIIGCVSLPLDVQVKVFLSNLLLVLSIAVAAIAVIVKRTNSKKAYILAALKFRREKMLAKFSNNDIDIQKRNMNHIYTTLDADEQYEHVYIVKVKMK